MTKLFVAGNFYQPFWPSSMHQVSTGFANAIPAGVTFQTTVPHPLAAIGEQCLKFDGNDATSHKFDLTANLFATGETTDYAGLNSSLPPDATLGWGIVGSVLLRIDATLPTSDALLLDTGSVLSATTGVQLWITSTGLAKLVNKATGLTMATGLALPNDATFYQMEIWERFKNSSGVDLAAHQYVVRYGTLAAPPVYTTLINTVGTPSGLFAPNIIGSGETTQRGAGFVYYLAPNAVTGWTNCDDTFGIYRIDRLDVDLTDNAGIGHLNTWTTPNPGGIDESGTAIPDDTDFGSNLWQSGQDNQLYTQKAGQTAAADTVIRLRQTHRLKMDVPKTSGNYALTESDGTNDRNTSTLSPTTSFVEYNAAWHKNASNAAWAQTDIAGLQFGAKVSSNGSGGLKTFSLSVQTVTVLYEKSGETGTALPAAPPVPQRLVAVKQAVNRGSTY